MVKIETLNELSQLSRSGFGRPSPRHGLNLLYWFAHDYVEIDSYGGMTPKVRPDTKAYGFHPFYNFEDEDHDHVLPNQNHPYYGVGNLNAPGANKLPNYVKRNYTHHQDDSNKDRIMVRLNGSYLERVYITEHIDQSRFGRTYRISLGLIENIRNLTHDDFIQRIHSYSSYERRAEPQNESWCTIL